MTKDEVHEQFKIFLKKGKHRITPERFEVLDFALDYRGHFGADELYIKMKNNNSNVSRATVYNSLELIAQCVLLVKRNFGDNKTHYESTFNRQVQDHLICVNCGKIKEFHNPKIIEFVNEITDKMNFESSGYSFNIFGKCVNPECNSKK